MGIRLAFPTMKRTAAGITVIFHYITGFAWPQAFGAIVGSTDPVLASLSSMNDGTKLPVLMLTMALLASKTDFSAGILTHCILKDILWALSSGLGIGFGMGRSVGKLVAHIRNAHQDVAPNDFFALELIAPNYAGAQRIDT